MPSLMNKENVIYIHIYVYSYLHRSMYVHTSTRIYMYEYIYTYIYIYEYTSINTYTHTYICVRVFVCHRLCLSNCTEHQNVIKLDWMLKRQRQLQIPSSHCFRVLFRSEWYGKRGGNGEQKSLIKGGGVEIPCYTVNSVITSKGSVMKFWRPF
jgi:hypothetical protein